MRTVTPRTAQAITGVVRDTTKLLSDVRTHGNEKKILPHSGTGALNEYNHLTNLRMGVQMIWVWIVPQLRLRIPTHTCK